MFIEIALHWTLNFVDQLYNEIQENWNSTNIDETTVNDWFLTFDMKLYVRVFYFFVKISFFQSI